MKSLFSRILFISLICSFQLSAQTSEESAYHDFISKYQSKYFTYGMLVQTQGEFHSDQISGYSGFSIPNFRLKLTGEFDEGFGYYMQTNFVANPSLLFGYVFYKINQADVFEFGFVKSPFSKEYLMSVSALDFSCRSLIVNSLAPKRQLGLQWKGNRFDNQFHFSAGIFNGNGGNLQNDNSDLMICGRVSFSKNLSDEKNDNIEIGLSSAFSHDTSGVLPKSENSIKKLFYGADIRLTYFHFLFYSEWIGISAKGSRSFEANPKGFQFTTGYFLNKKLQTLIKWENLRSNKSVLKDAEQLMLGINYFVTTPFKIQVNYIIPFPENEFAYHQFLVLCQFNI